MAQPDSVIYHNDISIWCLLLVGKYMFRLLGAQSAETWKHWFEYRDEMKELIMRESVWLGLVLVKALFQIHISCLPLFFCWFHGTVFLTNQDCFCVLGRRDARGRDRHRWAVGCHQWRREGHQTTGIDTWGLFVLCLFYVLCLLYLYLFLANPIVIYSTNVMKCIVMYSNPLSRSQSVSYIYLFVLFEHTWSTTVRILQPHCLWMQQQNPALKGNLSCDLFAWWSIESSISEST